MGGTEKKNAAKHVIQEHNTVEDDETENDIEKQCDDGQNREYEEVQAKEADKRKHREDEGGEDREEVIEDEEEREEEAEGEEEGDKAQEHSKIRGDEEKGNHDKGQEHREAM